MNPVPYQLDWGNPVSMEMAIANYCSRCGTAAQGNSQFCVSCGQSLVYGAYKSDAPVPNLISPSRIVFMSVLSSGLYSLYWFYKTWSHYRDRTGAVAYPVWHGLSLLIPIYGAFRAHAHMRSFAIATTALGIPVTSRQVV